MCFLNVEDAPSSTTTLKQRSSRSGYAVETARVVPSRNETSPPTLDYERFVVLVGTPIDNGMCCSVFVCVCVCFFKIVCSSSLTLRPMCVFVCVFFGVTRGAQAS